MFTSMPSVLSHAGTDIRIQSVETTADHILIRVRTDAKVPSGHHDTMLPALVRERLTLSDTHGNSAAVVQTSAQGDGPFIGIVDLAFPLNAGIDLETPLTLASEDTQLTFHL